MRIDRMFDTRPTSEEILPWLGSNPFGVHETLCSSRIAQDGHIAGLPAVYEQLEAAGWSKQPNWVKDRRKNWDELAKALKAGTPYRSWWP